MKKSINMISAITFKVLIYNEKKTDNPILFIYNINKL